MQRTFAMIKPDAYRHQVPIVNAISREGFMIVQSKKILPQQRVMETFYGAHQGMPFFPELMKFMMSGPSCAMVLEKNKSTVEEWRKFVGPTDPSKGTADTLRRMFWNGRPLPQNVIHGSDCAASAAIEIPFFFAGYELLI